MSEAKDILLAKALHTYKHDLRLAQCIYYAIIIIVLLSLAATIHIWLRFDMHWTKVLLLFGVIVTFLTCSRYRVQRMLKFASYIFDEIQEGRYVIEEDLVTETNSPKLILSIQHPLHSDQRLNVASCTCISPDYVQRKE